MLVFSFAGAPLSVSQNATRAVNLLYCRSPSIENYEPFGPLAKNSLNLDKNKSIVSRFSVFVVYKPTVSTLQKSSYVGCFNFRQWMFVFGHLFPDISIKSNKLHFQNWKNFSPMISLFFRKMNTKVSRNNCAKRHKDWKFSCYILDISKLAGSKLTRFRVCLSHFNIPLTKLKRLAMEMYRMKRLLNWLETRSLFIQQK